MKNQAALVAVGLLACGQPGGDATPIAHPAPARPSVQAPSISISELDDLIGTPASDRIAPGGVEDVAAYRSWIKRRLGERAIYDTLVGVINRSIADYKSPAIGGFLRPEQSP